MSATEVPAEDLQLPRHQGKSAAARLFRNQRGPTHASASASHFYGLGELPRTDGWGKCTRPLGRHLEIAVLSAQTQSVVGHFN